MRKLIFTIFLTLLVFILFIACKHSGSNANTVFTINNVPLKTNTKFLNTDTSVLEFYLIDKGLININALDTSIRVVLMYSTEHNFLHKPIYKGLQSCYLPCEVAIKLCNAQACLKQLAPAYSLIVFDGVRPLYIQKKMWDELDLPVEQKINYLAYPGDISLHNYGAAVDVGIIGSNNVLLDMGTEFDSFNELSQPRKELQFLKEGKLSASAYSNRLLLRNVMVKAGFMVMNTEWWHFNATNKATAAARYELIE